MTKIDIKYEALICKIAPLFTKQPVVQSNMQETIKAQNEVTSEEDKLNNLFVSAIAFLAFAGTALKDTIESRAAKSQKYPQISTPTGEIKL